MPKPSASGVSRSTGDSGNSSNGPLSPAVDDPPPIPPIRPDNDECCHSGCEPCIFELYEDAVDRYQIRLKAWEERQAKRSASSTDKSKSD